VENGDNPLSSEEGHFVLPLVVKFSRLMVIRSGTDCSHCSGQGRGDPSQTIKKIWRMLEALGVEV
jgi:hypothetical protein